MSPSKRLSEQTKFVCVDTYIKEFFMEYDTKEFECSSCKETFIWADDGSQPKFCPRCGRRNSDA